MEAVLIPARIDLPALGRSFAVERRQTSTATTTGAAARAGVRATERGDAVVLSGAVGDGAACAAALRRWLRRKARAELGPLIRAAARARGIGIRAVRIGLPRTRWGSCSARGTISLNARLLFLDPDDVRYVLLHELAHRRRMDHSPAFWALLESWSPGARVAARRLRRARARIPAWSIGPAARSRNATGSCRRRSSLAALLGGWTRLRGRRVTAPRVRPAESGT